MRKFVLLAALSASLVAAGCTVPAETSSIVAPPEVVAETAGNVNQPIPLQVILVGIVVAGAIVLGD